MENNKFISYIDEIAVTDESSKKITIDNLNLRKSSSTKDDIILTIPKGAEVEIIPENKGWSLIKYKDTIGFVYNKYLSDKKNEQTIKKYVNVATLNFRSGPSTSYLSLGSFNKGDKVEYLGTSGSWVKVKYNNKTGYVYGSYVGNYATITQYVTATTLNVRSGAGTSYSVLGSLSKGTKVEVISTTNGWSKINYNGSIGYVSSQYLSSSSTDSSTSTTSSSVNKVISLAKSLLGKSYVWGAQGPSTFDCSGFTYYVFKNAANITLPRVSQDQSTYGTYVSKSNLKVGDLVFFDTNGANDGNVSHVGIYLGNNQFIHASSSKGKVVISNLENYYLDRFVNGRRILK